MAAIMFGWLLTALYPPTTPGQSQELANRSSQLHAPLPPSLRSTPTLLSLPPELRLLIFEAALVEGEIKVKAHTTPPALLATNRQIRDEASGIWYTQNSFHFRIDDCDASIAYKFFRRTAYERLCPSQTNFTFVIKGKPTWDNLLDWCRDAFDKHTMRIDDLPLDQVSIYGALTTTTATALEISRASREKGESWEECKRTLESLRKVAVITDYRWLE